MIIANIGVMACDYWGIEQDEQLLTLYERSMDAFSYIYYVEAVLKMTALGFNGYCGRGSPVTGLCYRQDDEGERWFVSYAWLDDGMDVTPTAAVMSGDRVTLLLARGGGESGGFTLRDDQDSLLYAMEMGRGGSALRDEDVGVQVVAQEGPVADISTLNMQAPDDRVHLLPGEDKTLLVGDRFMMACNIDSHDDEETSWVLVY